MNEEKQAQLEVRITGPRVGEGRVAADDLARLLLNLQQAVSRVGEILYGGDTSSGKGRKKDEIEKLCRLVFVDWRAGSAVPVLEVAQSTGQQSLLGHIGERSAKALIDGLGQLSGDTESLPEGIDLGVLEAVEKLGVRLGSHFDGIELRWIQNGSSRGVLYDQPKRDAVHRWLKRPLREERRTVVGRLEDLLGHNRRVAILYEPNNTKWECHFEGDEVVPQLGQSWLGLVKLTGKAVFEDERRTLIVDQPIENVVGRGEAVAEPARVRLERRAREQGFTPIDDIGSWLDSFSPPSLEEGEADLYSTIVALRGEERARERGAGS